MKQLWNYINKAELKEDGKDRIFLLISALTAGCIGLAVRLMLPLAKEAAVEWSLVFAGYPAAIAWFSGILYLFKHPF